MYCVAHFDIQYTTCIEGANLALQKTAPDSTMLHTQQTSHSVLDVRVRALPAWGVQAES